MDRISFNNEIVLMRHAVRKARVAIASKLVKEIKLLNGRKHGDENVIEKCKRKANRLIKELQTLKKLKDDTISKFAITNTKDIKQVLVDPSVGIKTRIRIRLAFHKTLKEKVEKFRQTFPNYQEYFTALKEIKLKKKKSNANDGAVISEENITEPPDMTENNDENTESIATSNNISDEELCNSNSDNENDKILKSEVKQSKLSKIKTEVKNKKEKVVEDQAKNSTTVTSNINPKKCPIIKVVSKLAAVKRFNVADDVMENIGTEIIISDDLESKEDMIKVDTEGEDNNYLHVTRAVPPLASPNDSDEDNGNSNLSRDHYNSRNFFTNIDNKPKRKYEYERNSVNVKNKFARTANNQNNRIKNNSNVNKGVEQVKKNNDTANVDLHPSWAARKKQQDILKQGFQGKKIVFNDD